MSLTWLRERGGGAAWLKCTRAGENDPVSGEKWPEIRRVGSKADRLGFSQKSREFQPFARDLQMSLFCLRERGGGEAWPKCTRAGENDP